MLVALLWLAPAGGWAAVVDGGQGYVTVRAAPARDAHAVGRLADGAQAEVLEARAGWHRVRYPGGEGWVPPGTVHDGRPSAPAGSAATTESAAPGGEDAGERPPSGYLSQYGDDAVLPAVDPGSSLVSMVSGLLLVLALLAALAFAARRLAGRRLFSDRRSRGIQILATRALGARHGLLLVEAGGLVWLLAQGPDGVSLISEIRDAEALRRLNDRFGFLESPFEAELARQLDLESAAGEGGQAPREPSPEERLAALRRPPPGGPGR
ncbi:MAG: hypothetical protein Kow0092_14620 [Deferrisomatales bacterium]